MSSKKCSVRQFGQRSISSTFLFRASNRSIDGGKKEGIEAASQKNSHLSLSDFLNRKLHRSSVLPSSTPANQGKELPFSFSIRGEDLNKSAQGKTVEPETDAKFSIGNAFHIFKNVEKDKNNSRNCDKDYEIDVIDVDESPETRKRKTLFQGQDDKIPSRKRLVVLGEDSKLTHSKRRTNVVKKEPRPLYNHYKNGGGWWDDNMEGIDNEEVGSNDVWEGVGCTTLGGIEWH